MSVQVRNDIVNKSIILVDAGSFSKGDLVIAQDAGRTAVLAFGTLLAKVAASGKYTPFINEAAVDGTALPVAIYLGPEISAADLVAGDIEDVVAYEKKRLEEIVVLPHVEGKQGEAECD